MQLSVAWNLSAWPCAKLQAGRIVSYAAFGALVGAIGSALTFSPRFSGLLTIAISVVMMFTGIQMLGLLPGLGRLPPILPRSVIHSIYDLTIRASRAAAFGLGAATFFLPCGFTLALQLYVLSKADPAIGALTMLIFALGTLPALLGLSLLSSFITGPLQARFLTIAGAFVLLLGVMNAQFGLVQLEQRLPEFGVATTAAGSHETQAQLVEMMVVGYEYKPNRFVVKAGMPVEWRIDAREAEGCGRILVSRSLGLQKFLSANGTTVIIFCGPNLANARSTAAWG